MDSKEGLSVGNVEAKTISAPTLKEIIKGVTVSDLTYTERIALDNALWGNHPENAFETVKRLLLKRI